MKTLKIFYIVQILLGVVAIVYFGKKLVKFNSELEAACKDLDGLNG